MDRSSKFIIKISAFYLLILLFLNYHLPFSMFFNFFHRKDSLFKYVEQANQKRVENSQTYFSSINPSLSKSLYNVRLKKKKLDFAIGIITIKRTSESGKPTSHGYLLQSASSIDAMLKEKPVFNNSVGFICNVHSFPSQHSDAIQLYPYLPYIERYGKNSMSIPEIFLPDSDRPYRDVNSHRSVYQKETYDYVFCLQAAAALKPSYVLLIEEDIIPHPEFPDFLDHLVNFRLQRQNITNYAFIKFYFPAKWQGFSFNIIEVCDLISFCALGVTFFYFFAHHSQIHIFKFMNWKKVLTIGFLISLFTCYVLGRQNLNEFRRLSSFLFRLKPSDHCCTQAMLYPLNVVEDLPFFMISESLSAHTDLIIWDYLEEKGLPAYQIEPSLFYHTGLYSSLPLEQKHPEEFIIY